MLPWIPSGRKCIHCLLNRLPFLSHLSCPINTTVPSACSGYKHKYPCKGIDAVSEEMIGKKNRHTIAEKSRAPPARAQGGQTPDTKNSFRRRRGAVSEELVEEKDRYTMQRQDGRLQREPMAVTGRVGFGLRSADGDVESTYRQEVYRQAWASCTNRDLVQNTPVGKFR
jgi:hypothetical protein